MTAGWETLKWTQLFSGEERDKNRKVRGEKRNAKHSYTQR